ncbi:L-threo-3-hydroxyaspartate ammonia-lyase [Alphaproteobacteria bacterium SO-S41]|nr:L-threo-3-hydroxyaspartate ammonia-lyase [Alphaproteobacteria bacterium SO-S41]
MTMPSIVDVQAAARRLRGIAAVTPLLPMRELSAQLGRPVFAKAEVLQLTGSFKFRGAYNRIAAMTAEERAKGVVAFSSGNHAQGVAAAAQMRNVQAAIVMPSDAPRTKVEGTRSWGAEVIFYDRATESREAISEALAAERGATLIPSFDDPYVIAGQGTAGLEIASAVATQGFTLGAVVTPVGGGGLASGLALALEAAVPDCALYGVEPEGFDDVARSLATGAIVENERRSGSVQDALLTPRICERTFSILRRRMTGVTIATDPEALVAAAYALKHLRLVVEPGGAAALAGVLAGRIPAGDGALVIVLSGGNAEPAANVTQA